MKYLRSAGAGIMLMLVIFSITACDSSSSYVKTSMTETGPPTQASDLKELFPNGEWSEFEFNNSKFVFCLDYLPSFGVSRIAVHGWVFRDFKNEWENILVAHTQAVGNAKLSLDSETGMLSLVGSANNKFNNVSVVTMDLRTAEP